MKRLPMLRKAVLFLAVTMTIAWAASEALASLPGMAAANQVSQTSYRSFLGDNLGVVGILYTHTGSDRQWGPNHNLARTNIVNTFQSYGLNPVLEPFTYSGTTYYNVVATKVGTTHPNDEYIIGAHFDSVACPGADDNASGVSLVLEAARILSQYTSDYTIRFIAFDREEQGLYGSDAYASAHSTDSILGMISADMVSYDQGGNLCRTYGRSSSDPLKLALGSAIATYSGGLNWTNYGQMDASDHAPFEWQGFQACCLIENYTDNPSYHSTSDCVDIAGYINYAFAVKMTRSVVGFLVDSAGVNVPYDGLAFSYPNGRPTFSYPPGGPSVRVVVAGVGSGVPQPGTGVLHYYTEGRWQSAAMTVVSPNVYDAVLPAAGCGTTVQYYVSAQSTGGTTFNDPPDAPSTTFTTLSGYGTGVVYENYLNTNPGWTVQGQWAFGHPTGGGSHNLDPTNGYTGTNVYGYNLSGDYANNIPAYYLTTTPINCTGKYGVKLDFYRWLGVESNENYDKATIEASNNGLSWTTIWRAADTGAAVSDASWQHVIYDISSVADNKPVVQIRWGMGPTDSYVTYPGWNIDDVKLTSLQCTPQCGGPTNGDMNGDGKTNGADMQAFISAVITRATDPVVVCPGDFSGNLIVDMADVPSMVNALLGL
ncbi:MAG TPA: M28 family peptidase [Phycisphaerae bacterium]|nr:M28 family peptidase [Phycisphaerae bacterium]